MRYIHLDGRFVNFDKRNAVVQVNCERKTIDISLDHFLFRSRCWEPTSFFISCKSLQATKFMCLFISALTAIPLCLFIHLTFSFFSFFALALSIFCIYLSMYAYLFAPRKCKCECVHDCVSFLALITALRYVPLKPPLFK